MKKLLLLFPFLFLFLLPTMAQYKADADKLVDEGVNYHDKGDYAGAIRKYNKALQVDSNNLMALAEMAFTLLAQEKYDDAIVYCQKALATHPGENNLKTIYVTYGNALDGLKKTDEALDIYDQGIKEFPTFYQLHFNKGITLSSIKKYDEAISSFEKAVMANPNHASSHNAIARLSEVKKHTIPAILAYCRFLAIESVGQRAQGNLQNMNALMKGNATKTGKNSITINISADMLTDTLTSTKGKPMDDNFRTTELILSLESALDFEKKNKNKTEVELFIRKFETVCSSLQEMKKDKTGFFWEYYAPYFIEMKEKGLIEPFAYTAFLTSEDKTVANYVVKHKDKMEQFREWSKEYEWKAVAGRGEGR